MEVRFCSKRCRTTRPNREDAEIERVILQMLSSRAAGHTVCPSEVARAVYDEWRPQMERVRSAARRLAARGSVEIKQRGRVVDPLDFRGPIRIGLVRRQSH